MWGAIRNKHAYRLKSFYYKNFVQAHILLVTVASVLLLIPPLCAQSEVQGHSSIVFQNEKLSDVLLKLAETGNMNFSYDANDPVYNKRISYSSKGESTQQILNNVLSEAGLTHKLIGKQTVIYHSVDDQIIPTEEALWELEESNNKIIVKSEIPVGITEYEIDTIYIQDTIFRIDTIRITDTVFIEKEKPEKQNSPKIKEIPVDFFQMETDRDNGWAMDFYAAPLLSDFSLVKDDVSFTLRNFSLGIDAIKLLNRWNFSIGLHFSHFGHRFSQQYTKTTGGVYQTDTIDIYYTVVDIDTSWYYVTDSSWIPLESRDYHYEKTNTIGYLGLNASVAYDFYKSLKLRIYGKLGGQIGWSVYKNGIAIPDEEHAEGINFSDLHFNTAYSASLGAGLKYKITDDLDFNTELYYSRYLNQLVKEFEFDNRLNVIGLKIGIVYYF